jgi:hypothetical protein
MRTNPKKAKAKKGKSKKAKKRRRKASIRSSSFALYPAVKKASGVRAVYYAGGKKKKAKAKKKAKKNAQVTFTTRSGQPVSFRTRANPKKATKAKAKAKTAKATKKRRPRRKYGHLTVSARRKKTKKGTRRFSRLRVSGAKSVRVARGKPTKKGRKTLSVAIRNRSWYRNKTRAVANAFRAQYARANFMGDDPPDAEYWAWRRKQIADDDATEAAAASDTEAAAAAVAVGLAPLVFADEKEFNDWIAYQNKNSPSFRKYYRKWRMKAAAKAKKAAATRRKKKTKKAAKRKATKKAKKAKKGTNGRKTAKAKARARAYALARPRYKTGPKKGKWKPGKVKLAANRRRRARRNQFIVRTNRARKNFANVQRILVPGGMVLGGFVVHRLATSLLSGILTGMNILQPGWGDVAAGLATAIGGGMLANMTLREKAFFPTLGMVASVGAQAVKQLIPEQSAFLGRVLAEPTRTEWVLDGFGQPMLQAAAGEYYQPSMGEYYQPSMGEYVSDDLYPVTDFGEYVASNLDVQGYGDYEVEEMYMPSADGFGAIDDGVMPEGDLDSEFRIMEASAGVGQPFMQAAAGMGQPIMQAAAGPFMQAAAGMGYDMNVPDMVSPVSTYLPRQPALPTRTGESSADEGVFDIGGGRGIFG